MNYHASLTIFWAVQSSLKGENSRIGSNTVSPTTERLVYLTMLDAYFVTTLSGRTTHVGVGGNGCPISRAISRRV
jgi:hypothetical protein